MLNKTSSEARLSLVELKELPLDLLVLRGADGEENAEDSDDDATGENGDSSDSDSEDGDDDDDDDNDSEGSDEPDEKDTRISVLETRLQKAKDRKKAAEDRVTRLLAENNELKSKGVTDETTKNSLKEHEETISTLRETNQGLVLTNAFLLASNEFDFVDAEAAIKLLNRDGLEFNDDGTVDGIDEAIETLVREKPYLIKAASAPKPKAPAKKSGEQPGKNKAPRGEAARKTRESKLKQKYSGLRR